MSRDQSTVGDIVQACRRVLEFTRDSTQEAFFQDALRQSAVLYQITIVGEATRRLSPEFREMHVKIPWADIASMRNRLIHEYDQVDLSLVWDTVTLHVPELLHSLEPLLPQESRD